MWWHIEAGVCEFEASLADSELLIKRGYTMRPCLKINLKEFSSRSDRAGEAAVGKWLGQEEVGLEQHSRQRERPSGGLEDTGARVSPRGD